METEHLLLKCRSCGAVGRVPAARKEGHPRCGKCGHTLAFPDLPLHVAGASFESEVLKWPGRVMAEFEDRRCFYCQQIAPFIRDLTKRLGGRVKVVTVDIQAEPSLAARYGINATPTFILFQKGAQLARIDGAPSNKDELVRWALQK